MPDFMRPIFKDSTDQSVVIRIIDSTVFTPETAVTYSTSGLAMWYRREEGLTVSVTTSSLATLTASHTDGGFLAIADGYYRFDLPDAAVITGANGVMVGGTVTGMIIEGVYSALWDFNPYTPLATSTEVAVAVSANFDANGCTKITDTNTNAASAATLADAISDDLPIRMTRGVAFPNFKFYMVQSANPLLPATGLSVSCQRAIDDGAFSNCTNATATEVSAGWYRLDISDTDLDGDCVAFKFTATGAVQTGFTCNPQPT